MTPYSFQKKTKKEISLNDIIEARNNLAIIMTTYQNGENYLPIFERLQKEIVMREDKNRIMQKVQEIALKHCGV